MAGKELTIYVRVEASLKADLEAEAKARGEAAAVIHREILRRHFAKRAARAARKRPAR